MATTTDRIIGTESGGDPFARNSRSSAGGLGQFIDSTWLAMIAKHRPDVVRGKTREQILQLKFDPALSREMTQAYESDNATFLQARGIQPTPGNLKLAHFAGPEGAAKLHANPDAPVEAVLGRDAVAANPFLRGKRGADVVAWADKQMSGPRGPSQAMAANLQRRFAPKVEGGATAQVLAQTARTGGFSGGGGATGVAGGAGMDQLKSALGGKTYDADRFAAYGNLAKTGQDVASKATGWQQALLGIGTAGVGGYLQNQEKGAKKEFDAALMGAVAGAQNPTEVAQLLIQSPDEKMKAAGLELLVKNLGPQQSPQISTIKTPGQYPGQTVDVQVVPDGKGGYKRLDMGGTQQATPTPPQVTPQQPAVAPAPQQALTPNLGPQQPAAPGGMAPSADAQPAEAPLPVGGGQPAAVQAPPQPQPNGYQEVPADINSLPKPQQGWSYELGPSGKPLLSADRSHWKLIPEEELKARGKATGERAAAAPERAVTNKQISGNIGDLAEVINGTDPEKWGLAFGQYGGAENATPYDAPDKYLIGAAKRGGVALGEMLFGKEGEKTANDLRRKMDAPAADLVMTYRAIQKQRGVTDSNQSNSDLAFLESVGGRLKEAGSREAAYEILATQVRPIFERLTGQSISVPEFRELKKIKREDAAPEPAAPLPSVAGAMRVTGATPEAGNWRDYLNKYGF